MEGTEYLKIYKEAVQKAVREFAPMKEPLEEILFPKGHRQPGNMFHSGGLIGSTGLA